MECSKTEKKMWCLPNLQFFFLYINLDSNRKIIVTIRKVKSNENGALKKKKKREKDITNERNK